MFLLKKQFLYISLILLCSKAFAYDAPVQENFNEAINSVLNVYENSLDKKLVVKRNWSSDGFLIRPTDQGEFYLLEIEGGLIREKSVSVDAFLLMICHELGHFAGGDPKYGKDAITKEEENLTIEGQADYWSTQSCFREVFKKSDNVSFVEKFLEKHGKRHVLKDIVPESIKLCSNVWESENDIALCRRTFFAGHSFARTARIKRLEKHWVNITTPAERVVEETYKFHPLAQCRFDTFVAGALCNDVSGICKRKEGYTFSARPLCWFKPD